MEFDLNPVSVCRSVTQVGVLSKRLNNIITLKRRTIVQVGLRSGNGIAGVLTKLLYVGPG